MKMLSKVIFYFLLTLTIVLIAGGEQNDSDVFVATNEWKVVKKGQPIPKGLHVRYDFETKTTYAKLLDKDEDNREKDDDDDDNNDDDKKLKSLSVHPDSLLNENNILDGSELQRNRLKLSLEELKKKLKKIKYEAENDAYFDELDEEVKKKFRSYDELKKDLKSIEMNITTESEILKSYFEKFKNYEKSLTLSTLSSSEVDNILSLLTSIGDLLHQVDNAQLFADMAGMSKIISPCLNTTSDEIKLEALNVLGISVQSNPKVQLNALNNDLILKVLHLLTVNNNKLSIQSRCLFALSAMVRGFPASQKLMIDHGGIEIFSKILENGELIVQMRIMRLINDLTIERNNLENSDILKEYKLKEYKTIDFEKKLLSHNYCEHLTNILSKYFNDIVVSDTIIEIYYDFLETILDSFLVLKPTCQNYFDSEKKHLHNLINQLNDYLYNLNNNNESNSNINNNYSSAESKEIFDNLLQKISILISSIFDHSHEEL